MSSSDWDDFKLCCYFRARKNDTIEVSPPRLAKDGVFCPSEAFVEAFPSLTALLSKGRVTEFRVNDKEYQLYAWTGSDGDSIGWQCPTPDVKWDVTALHPDHRLLLTAFGGIKDHWDTCFNHWLENQETALCAEDTQPGFLGWEDYYNERCEIENLHPATNPSDYRAFSLEANGDCTVYHHRTGKILVFSHDPNSRFTHWEQLDGHPRRTLYTIKGCPDFRTWVETVTKQWLKAL